VWSTSGIYMDTIKSKKGCDSFMSINLTVGTPSSSTIQVTSCKRFVSPSKKYTWLTSGIYKDTIKNNNQCDSFLTIDLTINNVNTNYTRQGNNFIASSTTGTFQWMSCDNNNYIAIQNETNALFTAKTVGQYALEVSENNCKDTSACFNHQSLGLNNIPFETGVQISPNPTNGSFDILLNKVIENINLNIFDINGRVVLSRDYHHISSMIIESNLPQGIYLVKLSSVNSEGTYRIVIQ